MKWIIYLWLLGTPYVAAESIVVTTGEWPPLISEKQSEGGPISVVVKEAFALKGIEVKFRFLPWKRAMREVSHGSAVASSAWRKTDARMQDFMFSDEIYDNQNVFFYLNANKFHWQQFSDLKKYYIGGALGYVYSEEFQQAELQGEFEVTRVNKERSLVGMLLSGRIDAFPANREVGLHLIRTVAPETFHRFAIHPKALTRKPVHLLVNKGAKGQALLDQFNAGLLELKSSGRFDEIHSQGAEY